MRGENKVILVGNAARHAERKQTESGNTVTVIGLATNRQSNGAEVSQYHRIVCWDTLAETAGAVREEGATGLTSKAGRNRMFGDDEGRARGGAEIVAADVQFLDRPPSSADDSAALGRAIDPVLDNYLAIAARPAWRTRTTTGCTCCGYPSTVPNSI